MFLTVGGYAYAQDEKVGQYALVIGNKDYPLAPLDNSVNDAQAIAANLNELGFDVTLLRDTQFIDLSTAIEKFYNHVQKTMDQKAVAVFYYAGHAIQIDHRNYLVPIDVKFGDSEKFIASLYDINLLFNEIPPVLGLQNVIILDACRDNPFAAGGDDSDMVADGLAPLRAPPGTLIAYATEPGSVASDGDGENGIYTKNLLKHLDEMISIEEVFKKVRRDVAKETRNEQIPWEHSSLLEEVFINPPKNRKVPNLISF
jgi:uncharacterized caspase-like protein